MDLQTSIDNSTPKVDMELLNKIVEAAGNLKDNPEPFGRKGGYLALYDKKLSTMAVVPVGKISHGKEFKYLRNACEKVTRILKENAVRSFDSWNEEKEQWGGGLMFLSCAVSFSGFVELIDEAISVVYGTYYSFIYHGPNDGDHKKIIDAVLAYQAQYLGDNPFCISLVEAVFGEKK